MGAQAVFCFAHQRCSYLGASHSSLEDVRNRHFRRPSGWRLWRPNGWWICCPNGWWLCCPNHHCCPYGIRIGSTSLIRNSRTDDVGTDDVGTGVLRSSTSVLRSSTYVIRSSTSVIRSITSVLRSSTYFIWSSSSVIQEVLP